MHRAGRKAFHIKRIPVSGPVDRGKNEPKGEDNA
ncbi:hypothetical protein X474_02985 [Dethiosulfatarculus sandiegensis]|uniref:Uncharacterized protein n=1 Tax=Dethiosulfatarculus sandiegensis TaxID=1429043 RepID=A0A0D2JC78_9BACT|nr:hypothetical protein X474_02985 [Dethiosulfatarculus sandiegensis]